MANTAQLKNDSKKQTRNSKLTQEQNLKARPPLKKLPPPDDDTLVFLPIG